MGHRVLRGPQYSTDTEYDYVTKTDHGMTMHDPPLDVLDVGWLVNDARVAARPDFSLTL